MKFGVHDGIKGAHDGLCCLAVLGRRVELFSCLGMYIEFCLFGSYVLAVFSLLQGIILF